jgi:sugar phosphate permease
MKRYYPWLIAMMGLLVLMISNGLTITGITAFDPSLLAEFGWSRAALKFRDLLTLLLAGLLAPFLSVLIDRIGPKTLVLGGSLLLALLYFAYSQIHSITHVYLIHIGFPAVLVAAGLNVAVIMVSQWFVAQRGVALGITLIGSSLGGVVLPKVIVAMLPVLGWRESFMWLSVIPLELFVLVLLYDHFGSYHVAFLVICTLVLVAFFAAMRVRHERLHLVSEQATEPATP